MEVNMNNKICNFFKTDHFLFRQWDRGIEDLILENVLAQLKPPTDELIIIVSRGYLRKFSAKKTKELVIVAYGKSLITYYYCDVSELFKKRNKVQYIFINQ